MHRILMSDFSVILNKRLKNVSYLTSFEGHENRTVTPDFDYLPLGGLTLIFDDNSFFCIADYYTTKLGTEGVGIKNLTEFQGIFCDKTAGDWHDKIGKQIKLARLYWNMEKWNNGFKNELYAESVELIFENNKSIFYFCGAIHEYNSKEKRYTLTPGRSNGIIFYDAASFKKYGLDKVFKIEEVLE